MACHQGVTPTSRPGKSSDPRISARQSSRDHVARRSQLDDGSRRGQLPSRFANSFTNSKTLGHGAVVQSNHTGTGMMTHGDESGSCVPRKKSPRTAFVPGLPQLGIRLQRPGRAKDQYSMASSLTMTTGCHSWLPPQGFFLRETPFTEAEGVSRICRAGEMQTPPLDWHNGGVDLRELLHDFFTAGA